MGPVVGIPPRHPGRQLSPAGAPLDQRRRHRRPLRDNDGRRPRRRDRPVPVDAAMSVQSGIPAVVLERVTKTYGGGRAGVVRALDDVSLVFESGTFTAIMGPSGS